MTSQWRFEKKEKAATGHKVIQTAWRDFILPASGKRSSFRFRSRGDKFQGGHGSTIGDLGHLI
jgi:hypothetical protein